MVNSMTAISFPDAMSRGLIKPRSQKPEDIESIIKVDEIQASIYGLRFPERDSKTDADFMRISFKEEDEEFLKE